LVWYKRMSLLPTSYPVQFSVSKKELEARAVIISNETPVFLTHHHHHESTRLFHPGHFGRSCCICLTNSEW
jgi:hypothetical protein